MTVDISLPAKFIPPPAGSIQQYQLDYATNKAISGVMLGYQSGRWYGSEATPVGTVTMGSATAMTANRHYALPLFVPSGTSFKSIGLAMTTAAGTAVRFGFYESDNYGNLPGTLDWSTATIAPAVGNITAVITWVAPYTGLWWMVVACDGNAQVQGSTTAMRLYGAAAVNENAAVAQGAYADRVDTTMANPFGTPSGYLSGQVPLVRMQVT